MHATTAIHYEVLGLDSDCTTTDVRAAYRSLIKRYHPDINPESPETLARVQALNAAHETLSDPQRRRAYDRELSASHRREPRARGRIERNISHDANLRTEDFFRGATLDIRVDDPANSGPESYQLVVPPMTAPGTRFRLPRVGSSSGGFVDVRLRALPGFRFKARGSDLRCDLRIDARLAAAGGVERITGPTGNSLRVVIPARIRRGEIIRLPGEGLPKARGGRGDLLVRVIYRLAVRITHRH